MATKLISEEEAFKAGFEHGYRNGRVSELSPRAIEINAEAAYREWKKKQTSFSGAVVPVTGVKRADEK